MLLGFGKGLLGKHSSKPSHHYFPAVLQNLCVKFGQVAPAVEAPVRLDTGFRDLECLHLAAWDSVG